MYISSYLPMALSKILPHSKTAKKMSVFGENAVYVTFYKLIFFETLIIFLESAIKLITGIFDFQK